MPDFGPQSGYILASYGVAMLILSAMIVLALTKRAAARRRLARIEVEGGQHGR
ncbi:MAG: heme exporter protein CcmD [Proteobacteria bacterium]|nr:heme exporter protein CcmD [Pseudomonadota bacterium]